MGRWQRATRSCARPGASSVARRARRSRRRRPNPRGRAAGVERLDGRRLERGRGPRQEPAAALRRPRPAQPPGDERLLARLPARRRLAQAAALGLGGAGAASGQEAVQFGGSTLRVLAAARARRDPQLARLGPDVLAPEFDLRRRSRRACGPPSPTRTLGDALLDQTLLAGIGNIFKSEAAFAARVDPWRPLGDLSEQELRARPRSPPASRCWRRSPTGRHTVRRLPRAARPCPACGGRVSSRGQGDANRTTYWCPRCQG